MVSNRNEIPSLGEAAARFLATLPAEKREASRPEVYKFARWYGWESSFSSMSPPSVAGYAEQLSASDTDLKEKLGMVRDFLAYGKKSGWSKTNLGTHLKSKKAKTSAKPNAKAAQREVVTLTQERYEEIKQELTSLQKRSQELIKALVMKDLAMIDAPDLILRGMMGPINRLSWDVNGIGFSVYFFEEFMAPNEKIKLCGIDDVVPNYENIRTRKYPFTTEVYVVIRSDLDKDGNAYKLRDWLLSNEGQEVVKESGYVPIS